MTTIETGTDTEFPKQTFQDFQDIYNQSSKHIESGYQAEIQGKTQMAIQVYTEGLQMMEQLLSTECSKLVDCTPTELSQATEMQQQVIILKQKLSGRLQMLKTEASHSKYEQAVLAASSKLPDDNLDQNVFGFDETDSECYVEGTEIFILRNAALMVSISSQGIVTPFNKYLTLHVVKFDHGFKSLPNGAFIPPAFLQVGDWVYPLMPGLSPALITKYRTYIFPDVLSEDDGAATAIVLPQWVPKIDRMRFEVILDHFTVLDNKHIHKAYLQALLDMDMVAMKHKKSTLNIASIISFLITVAASLTAWVITTGALLIIWLVQLAFRIIRSQIKPAEEPSIVHPSIRQGVTYVKTTTHATVKVKQYVVNKLGESTMSLALTIAPIIKDQGEKVLPEFLRSASNEFVKGTLQITSSTIEGMTRVSRSVDRASLSLMNNLTRESLDMIGHRFGDDVETFASDTLTTAQCMVRTARSARNMNLTRFAVRAGKPQGKAVLHNRFRSLEGSIDARTILTPAVFIKANAILHNSTLMYVKILETISRSKLDLRRRSRGTVEETRHSRRASVDGVIRPRSGKRSPYSPVYIKNRFQEKRFSLPNPIVHDADGKYVQYMDYNSAHNLLTKVVSVNEAASKVSLMREHVKNATERYQEKYQAIEEDVDAKIEGNDVQSQVTRRSSSSSKSSKEKSKNQNATFFSKQ